MVRTASFGRISTSACRVVEIEVPPLRERAHDIPILAEHFVRNGGAELRQARTAADASGVGAALRP